MGIVVAKEHETTLCSVAIEHLQFFQVLLGTDLHVYDVVLVIVAYLLLGACHSIWHNSVLQLCKVDA